MPHQNRDGREADQASSTETTGTAGHGAPRGGRGRERVTKAAVFGTGSWGTAFAMVLADAGCEVTLWGRRPELAEAVNTRRVNPDYLPDVELPAAVTATTDAAEAADGRGVHRARRPLADVARKPRRVGAAAAPGHRARLADEGRRTRHGEADERGRRGGRRRGPLTGGGAHRARTSRGRSPHGSRPRRSSRAPTRAWPSGCRPPAIPRTSARTPTPTSSDANSAARSRT